MAKVNISFNRSPLMMTIQCGSYQLRRLTKSNTQRRIGHVYIIMPLQKPVDHKITEVCCNTYSYWGTVRPNVNETFANVSPILKEGKPRPLIVTYLYKVLVWCTPEVINHTMVMDR